ncbi:polysaccharide deacetylase family protein [Chitinivibrio alkaliphilus]|uniref:Polysaccharide deacetylase n=1 Tax=Chitinivibrio alkaliphilus ACht1 TaxID=1313304 RepID=U7DBY0_9BACT|nr:polysaccharide deacetylase family protein [Chitinivibrio alkaliphilus]ERP39088.1 polysaccharide deacetylase [Chitinivibrio alkaliphilus ACht1]
MKYLSVLTAMLLCAVSLSFGRAHSLSAPVNNPPQLIVLGSDDNTSTEGMEWIVEYLASKTHADGTPLRMSFYSNTLRGWDDAQSDLVQIHARAYQDGHEVSSHTHDHMYFLNTAPEVWSSEEQGMIENPDYRYRASRDSIQAMIEKNIEKLKMAGVPREHMQGFRVPYLAFTDPAFTEINNAGFVYDHSVTESQGGPAGNNWPYTMENGVRNEPWYMQNYDVHVGSHRGLWQLPVYSFQAHPDDWGYLQEQASWNTEGEITGLDYNMWANPEGGHKLNKTQSINALKYTLDQSLEGTRAPMTIGMHSQYYVDDYDASGFPHMENYQDRREVIEAFIDYALTKDNVWFVTGAQVIQFMENPVSASSFDPDNYTWEVDDDHGDDDDDHGDDDGDHGDDDGDFDVYTELLGRASWSSWADDFGTGSEANVDDADEMNVILELTQGEKPEDDDDWPSASATASVAETFDGVTHIEISYTADASFTVGVGTDAQGFSTEVSAGTNETETIAISDLDYVWGDDELIMEDISGITFGTVEEGPVEITLTSVKVIGVDFDDDDHGDDDGDDSDDDHGDDNGDTSPIDVVSFYSNMEKDSDAVIVEDDNIITITRPEGEGAWASAGMWVTEDFTLENVRRISVTYSSDADFEIQLPMPETGDAGTAHRISLPKSEVETTIEVGILDSRQPSWISSDDRFDLDPAAVAYPAIALDNDDYTEEVTGTITVEQLQFIYEGDPGTPDDGTPLVTEDVSTRQSLSIDEVTRQGLNLTVPESGTYTVSLYAADGRLIQEVSQNLSAGVNSMNFTNRLSTGMFVVRVHGQNKNAVSRHILR